MSTDKSFKHKTPIEIRFSDIDALGHVNNANFLTYFELGRIRYFDTVIGDNQDWSKKGLIVARAEINYIQPVRFQDKIVAYTNCSRLGNKSFDLQCRLFRVKDGEEYLVADGVTVMVAFDYTEAKAIEVPLEWKQAIEKFEGQV